MRKILILFLVSAALAIAVFVWWNNGTAPVDKKTKESKIFVVQKGEGIRSIAKRLKNEKLIKDQVVFFILVKWLGFDAKIQAGDFRLSPSMDTKTLLRELTHGTLDIWVTFPEGLRSEEVAEILKDKVPTYEESWLSKLKKNEGYLFPDTYLIPKDADIELVLAILKSNFDRKVIEQMQDDLAKDGRTLNEAIILASLIEREARFEEDRPKVASVLLNRLGIGMKLDVDATVQYALGFQGKEGWWKRKLNNQDLKFNFPYNTYLYSGLPPKPIASPGLASIKASVYPQANNYLYYLSDKEGRMYYAQTFKEHQKNIEKYL